MDNVVDPSLEVARMSALTLFCISRAVHRRHRRLAGLLLVVAIVVVAAAVLIAPVLFGLPVVDALKAAGLAGSAPAQGASLFQTLIGTLESNEKWLFFTGFGLGLTTVALMFFLGSMRAPDYLFKMLGAVVLILIITPAVLA